MTDLMIIDEVTRAWWAELRAATTPTPAGLAWLDGMLADEHARLHHDADAARLRRLFGPRPRLLTY